MEANEKSKGYPVSYWLLVPFQYLTYLMKCPRKINKCIDGLNWRLVCRPLYIIITIKCFLFVIHAGYEDCDISEISAIPEEKIKTPIRLC